MSKEITLRVGDDSNTFGDRYVINITTSIDLTGWSGRFQIQNQYMDISTSQVETKKIDLIFTKEFTSKLTAGYDEGYLKLFSPSSLAGTIEKKIPVRIYPQEVSNNDK